jgi:hypothetical protein
MSNPGRHHSATHNSSAIWANLFFLPIHRWPHTLGRDGAPPTRQVAAQANSLAGQSAPSFAAPVTHHATVCELMYSHADMHRCDEIEHGQCTQLFVLLLQGTAAARPVDVCMAGQQGCGPGTPQVSAQAARDSSTTGDADDAAVRRTKRPDENVWFWHPQECDECVCSSVRSTGVGRVYGAGGIKKCVEGAIWRPGPRGNLAARHDLGQLPTRRQQGGAALRQTLAANWSKRAHVRAGTTLCIDGQGRAMRAPCLGARAPVAAARGAARPAKLKPLTQRRGAWGAALCGDWGAPRM